MKDKMKNKKVLKVMGIVVICMMLVFFVIKLYKRYYDKPEEIVFISKSVNPQFVFWETMRMGAELAAKEEEVEIRYVGPMEEKDIETQLSLLEQCIEQRVDIIILAAAHNEKLSHLVKEAMDKGITVLTVDSTSEGVPGIKQVATNSKEAATLLTKYLIEKIGEQGEVVMLNFIQGTSTAIEREKGYEEALRAYPDILKRETIYTEGTSQSAYEATLRIIEKYPHIKGILGANQYMTEGIYRAIEKAGLLGQIKIVGFDGSPLIIRGIEKGYIDAIIIQKPFNIGYLGVKNAIKLFNHQNVPEYIDTGHKLITKESLYRIENQKLLYPIIK